MTEGLNHISVRVYRVDETGHALLRGSGTLFEDNGYYYVLTAYHCLEKEIDGVLISENLKLTDITYRYNRQDIGVEILGMVDKNKENDWALLSVKKPSEEWKYEGKVKLTPRISIGTTYESYPYVTALDGKGRYTELRPVNDEGDCHIVDDMAGGRFQADTVMKGGSGAGIMLNIEGTLYCFGFMKETLPGGQLNDVKTVCVDDVIPLLSLNAERDFTPSEQYEIKREKRKEKVTVIAGQLTQQKSEEDLLALVYELLSETIPSLINNLQDDLAKDLFDLIDQHCSALFSIDARMYAQYYYCRGQYFRLKSETKAARDAFMKGYELNSNDIKLKTIEARRLWKQGNQDDARKISSSLPQVNNTRIAIHVLTSEKPEEEFLKLPEDIRNKYSLRYLIIDLMQSENGMPKWLMQGVELKELETLTLENLPDWMYLFTCLHYQVQGVIPLTREFLPLDNPFNKAFYAAKRYYMLAKATPLEHVIPFLEALYCYWGNLVERDKKWLERFQKLDFSGEGTDQQIYGKVLLSSMYALDGRFDDAYGNIIKHKELPVNNLVVLFIGTLSCVSGKVKYIESLIRNHKELSIGESTEVVFVQLAQIFQPKDFDRLLTICKFEDDTHRKIISDYNLLLHGNLYSLDGYENIIPSLAGDLAAAAAILLFHAGEKERAIEYLKQRIDKGEQGVCVDTYYKLIAQDNIHRPEYFEYLQKQRKSGAQMTEGQLRDEYNYSLMLQDFDNAFEVIRILWNRNQEDEWATAAYLMMLARKGKNAMSDMVHRIARYEFKKADLVQKIYFALTTNDYIEIATDFLYNHSLRLQEDGLTAFYNQQAIMGYLHPIVNKQYEEVIDGSYVLYTTDGSDRLCRKVNAGTILGEYLLGHHQHDILTVRLSGEDKQIKILGIFNKYYYLHHQSMKEIMETGGNAYFKPFRIENPDSEEAKKQLLDFLEKMSGADERRKAIEKYKRGELGLIHFVDDNSIFGGYYELLFSDFPRLTIPFGNYLVRCPKLFLSSCVYVLDITSLLLLFEFSLLHQDWKPRQKFQLPKLLRELVLMQQKTLRTDVSAGLHKAMSTGKLYKFSDDYGLNMEQRFKALETWIDEHCDLVASPDILKVEQPSDSQKGQLLTYTLVEFLRNDPKRLKVLLSEDFYYQNMCQNLLPLVSTESYMYKMEGVEWGRLYTAFVSAFGKGK